jgi:ankyrin repeat protein
MALLLAKVESRSKIFKLDELLKHDMFRASVNVEDENGITPLMVAAYHFNSTLVRMLINAGARLDVTDKRGTMKWFLCFGFC